MDEENILDDEGKFLDVDLFLDLYKTALYWNRRLFQDEQDRIIDKRRECMKERGIGRDYKELCLYLEQRGERYMTDIFD